MFNKLRLNLDNFRGFTRQQICLGDISFLVGENSTGKSSLIYSLQLLTNPDFWFNQDFRTDDFQIHSFKDIVSLESDQQDFFSIGMELKQDLELGFLLRFKEDNGKPTVKNALFNVMNKYIFYEIKKNSIKYKIYENNSEDSMFDKIRTQFEYNKLTQLEDKLERTPLMIALKHADNYFSEFYGERVFRKYFKIPFFTENISFIAPIRSKPKKHYDQPVIPVTSEGDHVPYMLRTILKKENNFTQNIVSSLSRFGDNSGLFRKLDLKEYDDSPDSPFQLKVVLNKNSTNLVSVGYGVSQSLPILTEIVLRKKKSIFIIQQPEVHLHPKAQAAIGDLIYDSTVNEQKIFLIETHSDYIIDRLRQRMNSSNLKEDVKILFFNRKEGLNKVSHIKINKNGEIDKNQPQEFREFFIKEELNNIGIV